MVTRSARPSRSRRAEPHTRLTAVLHRERTSAAPHCTELHLCHRHPIGVRQKPKWPLMGWTGCFPQPLAFTGERPLTGEAAMKARTTAETARLAVIGVDIGKEVFHLVAFDTDGKIAFRKKIRRLSLLT